MKVVSWFHVMFFTKSVWIERLYLLIAIVDYIVYLLMLPIVAAFLTYELYKLGKSNDQKENHPGRDR